MKKVSCPSCNADSGDDFITMHSGVNQEGRGFVHLAWGRESELRAQFTPAEVRQHALSLLEAAEAAEGDSMVLKLMTDRVGLDRPRALQIIGELRGLRDSAKIG